MLWNAGQKRIGAEARDRLAELYLAARDGYISAQVLLRKARAKGDHVPSYARPPTPPKGLAQLMRDFPSMTSREPSEFRN